MSSKTEDGVNTPLGERAIRIERACALQRRARDQVADVPELGKRLRGIGTDWRIELDEVACPRSLPMHLWQPRARSLRDFEGDKVLKPQDARRFAGDKKTCLKPGAESS